MSILGVGGWDMPNQSTCRQRGVATADIHRAAFGAADVGEAGFCRDA